MGTLALAALACDCPGCTWILLSPGAGKNVEMQLGHN